MKVDGITLLQMIKDGKITKNTSVYTHGKRILWGENGINVGEEILVWESEYKGKKITVDTYDLLNNEFEIELIEEPKTLPSKIDTWFNCESNFNDSRQYIDLNAKQCYEKINELIDYLSSKERDE